MPRGISPVVTQFSSANLLGISKWGPSFLLILLILLITTTPRTSAQGELNRMYPDEITIDELELYGGMLKLSKSQFVTVLQYHSKYLERFSQLKETRIDPHHWPRTEAETFSEYLVIVEKYWRETEEIRKEIRRVDASLFVEIVTILDDSQFPAMGRVRDHRERRTLRITYFLGLTQRHFDDMTKFAYDLDLDEDDKTLVEPLLVEYERKLTGIMKTLHDKVFDIEVEPYRVQVQRGFGDTPLRDNPDAWQESMRLAWLDRGPRIEKLFQAIDDLNETMIRRVEQTLSHDGIQAWLDEFMTRNYFHANRPRLKRRPLMKAINQVGPLSERDETTLRELLLVFDASLRRIERRMIELDLKYQPRVYFTSIEEDLTGAHDEYGEKLFEASKEIDALVDTFLLQLEQSLSAQGFAEWDAAYASVTKRKSTRPTHVDGQDINHVSTASIFFKPRDIRLFVRIFELNGEQQAVLQEAYLVYGKRKTTLEPDLPERKRYKHNWPPPLPGTLRNRLRQADEIILSALDRQLGDESDRRKVGWLRNAHRRIRLGRQGPYFGAGSVDLVLFILDSDLATEEIETLSPLIDEYDAQATGLYERLHASYTTHYEWFTENQDDEPIFLPHQDAWTQAQFAIANLNADTIRVIGEQLDSEEGTALIELFTRCCYGPVFADPNRTLPILQRAKRLEDLTSSQKEAILDLEVMYLAEYDRLTEAMLDDARYTVSWGRLLGDTFRAPIGNAEYESYKRHHFERDELNAATRVGLHSILTAEQIESMGGLLMRKSP